MSSWCVVSGYRPDWFLVCLCAVSFLDTDLTGSWCVCSVSFLDTDLTDSSRRIFLLFLPLHKEPPRCLFSLTSSFSLSPMMDTVWFFSFIRGLVCSTTIPVAAVVAFCDPGDFQVVAANAERAPRSDDQPACCEASVWQLTGQVCIFVLGVCRPALSSA